METLFYEQIRKKFGKYAIHNLTMVLIMCYVALCDRTDGQRDK